MNRNLYILLLLALCNQILLGQIQGDTSYYDEEFGNVGIWTNTDDKTIEIRFHGGYIVKDSSDRILIDGNKSGDCGCEPIENGFWIYYYENGRIREQGSYDCGEKIGTWIRFYENGSIKQVANYKKPYSDSFVRQFGSSLNLRRIKSMNHGQFIEYYEDGQIKTSGQFEILHLKSNVDSLVKMDTETYENEYEKIEGEFWLPRSIKTGTWKYYSINGQIQRIENHKIEEDVRELDFKYWELMELVIKEKPTHNRR